MKSANHGPRFTPPGGRHSLAHFIERLCLSEALSLPLDAVTRHIAVVGHKDVGAHAAAVLVEEMVSDGVPVVVLDTKGTWRGLERAADGTRPGLPIHAMGGPGGESAVNRGVGGSVADYATTLARPLVVDLGGMLREDAAQFARDFVGRLGMLRPRAMHLVLDDAQILASDLDGLGRAGLFEMDGSDGAGHVGTTWISDRSTRLDRRAVARADVLVAGRTAERPEQDVVWSWVEARADRRTATRVVESLASMADGEVWVCSPEWLGSCQRLTLRPRATCAGWTDRGWGRPPQTEASANHLRRLQARVGEGQAQAAPEVAKPFPAAREASTLDALSCAVALRADRLGVESLVAPRPRRAAPAEAGEREPRRGRPVARLVLARSEKAALERFAARGGGQAAVAQRARIILACAAGRLNGEVARELGITNQMVGRWRRRFVERRLDGLWREESVPAGGRFADRATPPGGP